MQLVGQLAPAVELEHAPVGRRGAIEGDLLADAAAGIGEFFLWDGFSKYPLKIYPNVPMPPGCPGAGLPGSGPVATGRAGSAIQPDHDPA